LKSFLDDAGADKILCGIEKMKDYRRAVDAATYKKEYDDKPRPGLRSIMQFNLLKEGRVEEFNEFRIKYGAIYLDFSGADLSDTELSGARLSLANLSKSDLSLANLYKANLSHAELSDAKLLHA